MMMPYNPPYYGALITEAGFKKAKDLWSYDLSTSVAPPEKVVRVAEKAREQEGVRVRPLEMKNLSEDIPRETKDVEAWIARVWKKRAKKK